MSVIEEIFFLPPLAVARLGGSDTPLGSFTWVEDPSQHGAGATVLQPTPSLEVQAQDNSVRPVLRTTIQFRDGKLLRPVAPFFELWAKLKDQPEPVPLTSRLLIASQGSLSGVTYTITVANRKAARRTGVESCAFQAELKVAGDDHTRHQLLASSQGDPPLVLPEKPILLGQFQGIRPVSGIGLGIDLDQLRVRFTPATGQVYGPPTATTATDPDGGTHQVVPPANRILNQASPWIGYRRTDSSLNHPVPGDTYDGADDRSPQSFGVVDDTCDGIIEAVVVAGGQRLRAVARVVSAPPDFAPDRRPFVSLADELVDRDPPSPEPQEDIADALTRVADLFQRVNETVSLANVDAMRLRSVGGGQPGGRPKDSPRTNDESMTPADPLFDQEIEIPPSVTEEKVPYHDFAVDKHGPLADADDLALFLRTKGARVKELVRPPYGAFKELDPAPKAKAMHRDPRIERDTLHDMRMPPYMIDSDGSALSLTRRQYDLLMDVVDGVRLKPGTPAASQPLPTATNAHVAKVLARQKKRDS